MSVSEANQQHLKQQLMDPAPVDFGVEGMALFSAGECGEGMSPTDRDREEQRTLLAALAERLVRARNAAGLRQADVAMRMGHANLTMISLFESGSRAPSLKNLQVLAELYCVTTDYLLGRTDDLGLSPEDGNQALITGVLTQVLTTYNDRYLKGLAGVTAIAVEGASQDRVLLGRVADLAEELASALAVIHKHHGKAFDNMRGGSKMVRLIGELQVSVQARIKSKQREKALMDFEHPVCTVQQIAVALQGSLFAD